MMRPISALLVLAVLAVAGCHPGPVLTTKLPVGGTVSGLVSDVGNAPISGRKVTAVNVSSGERFDATTGVDGGYTIQVPEGTYRLALELHTGGVVTKQPPQTRIDKSDLDPHRNFTISAKTPD